MPPEDMTFKMQKRLPQGNASDWVIVKLMYPKPNSIRVEVNGQPIKPISLLDNNGEVPLNTSLCGSNKFFYQNYTIHFVVTGDPNCKVRVTLTNSIQLTARFAMNIDDFFNEDGVTKFINRMCALLQINDTSRVKVVGIYTGSVNIVTMIDAQPVPLSSSTTDVNSAQVLAVAAIQTTLNNAINDGSFSSTMTSGGLGAVTSVTSTVINLNPSYDTNNNNNNNNNNNPTNPTDPFSNNNSNGGDDSSKKTKMIIGIVIGGSCLICLAILGAVCYMRKKAKIGQISQEELQIMESESHNWEIHVHEKSGGIQ